MRLNICSRMLLFFFICAGTGILDLSAAEIVWSSSIDAFNIKFEGGSDQKIKLVELAPYEELKDAEQKTAAWSGVWKDNGGFRGNEIEFAKEDGKRDRSFSRWVVLNAETNEVLQKPFYPESTAAMFGLMEEKEIKPPSIKGIQCVVDHLDTRKLGIKHVAHNVDLKQLFDFTGKSSEVLEVDGEKIHFNQANVKQLDRFVSRMSNAGVSVNLILLNYVPNKPDPNNPLIHPATNLEEAPNHLGAFNLTDRKGYLYYRAALEFLVTRYSENYSTDDRYGKIDGLIIGNELQAHWWWYNMGEAEPADVVRNYEKALRIARIVVEKENATNIKVYVSMDHHWTASMVPNKKRFIPGKTFLEGLNWLASEQGDFEWHVAFHPYPENLFEPRTWNDQHAELHFETPKITFKNLEVLTEFLNQDEFIYSYDDQPRRVILSEQGFHAGEGEEGELVQAAAYAYAYYRASHLPGIDAFILHRHVDHAHEGGLKLGVRANKPGTISDPGPKRKIYEVFKQADRKNWQEAFEFAKPIIGIQNWSELDPQKVTYKPGIRRSGSAVGETKP